MKMRWKDRNVASKRLLLSFYLEGGIRRLHGEGKKPVTGIQKRLS